MKALEPAVTLKYLPGTSCDKPAVFFRTSLTAVMALRKGLAATAAGPLGAINFWMDDEGMYRGHHLAFLKTIESVEFTQPDMARKWARKWLLKIGVGKPA